MITLAAIAAVLRCIVRERRRRGAGVVGRVSVLLEWVQVIYLKDLLTKGESAYFLFRNKLFLLAHTDLTAKLWIKAFQFI